MVPRRASRTGPSHETRRRRWHCLSEKGKKSSATTARLIQRWGYAGRSSSSPSIPGASVLREIITHSTRSGASGLLAVARVSMAFVARGDEGRGERTTRKWRSREVKPTSPRLNGVCVDDPVPQSGEARPPVESSISRLARRGRSASQSGSEICPLAIRWISMDDDDTGAGHRIQKEENREKTGWKHEMIEERR